MKKVLLLLMGLIALGCSKHKDLYQITDYFVNELYTRYESYGMEGFDDVKFTNDKLYKVTTIGRIINVRIEKYVDDKEYEKLKNDLYSHYKKDSRVKDVYINQGGTIIIDCRR